MTLLRSALDSCYVVVLTVVIVVHCTYTRKMCKNNKANELQFSNKAKGKRMRVTSFERG